MNGNGSYRNLNNHSALVSNDHYFKESDCKKPWFYRDLLEGRVWRRVSSSTADLRSPGDMLLPALVKVLWSRKGSVLYFSIFG